MMSRINRRGLLRGTLGSAAGLLLGARLSPQPPIVQAAVVREPLAVVVAEGTNDDTMEGFLKTALAPFGGIQAFVKPGQVVCIKPNATWANAPHTASSTDPELLRALIKLVKEAGAKHIVAVDRCTIDPPAMCLEVSGIGAVVTEEGVEQVFTDRYLEPPEVYTDFDIPEGKAFSKLLGIKAAVEADVRINMAVAKTHLVLPVTLCCKHMMGFLQSPGALHASAEYLDQGIADINTDTRIKPAFHILEAVRVRVRGPSYGDGTDVTDPDRVKRYNQLLIGTDPVLIDSYAIESFFGMETPEILHVMRTYESNVGDIDYTKALASGRMVKHKVSAILPYPTPTPTITPTPRSTDLPTTPTATATTVPKAAPTIDATATPPPSPVPAREVARPANNKPVVRIEPTLDKALLPAAAIIVGAGVVIGRRTAKSLFHEPTAPSAANTPEEPKDDQLESGEDDDRPHRP
ncbi:MAG: DUF362 domain-containing protein [Anaerolineae bacterium]